MSKIVEAVNVMVSNKDKFDSVIQGDYDSEVFFRYARKHKWSIFQIDNDFFLRYYPGDVDLQELASWSVADWQDFKGMVSYSSKELATKEARESFGELYSVVKEKLFGMDDVLADIIGSDETW